MRRQVGAVRIDGSSSAQARGRAVSEFQKSEACRIALLAIRAAGVRPSHSPDESFRRRGAHPCTHAHESPCCLAEESLLAALWEEESMQREHDFSYWQQRKPPLVVEIWRLRPSCSAITFAW